MYAITTEDTREPGRVFMYSDSDSFGGAELFNTAKEAHDHIETIKQKKAL